MREKLKKINGQRMTFKSTFKRYGGKDNWHGYPEKTILLTDVRDSGSNLMTDHIWFRMTKGFERLGELKEGDKVQFDARVKEYTKGYIGHKEEVQWERPLEKDFKLNFPTKIIKEEKE